MVVLYYTLRHLSAGVCLCALLHSVSSGLWPASAESERWEEHVIFCPANVVLLEP
jgi:hypothetical protein